MSSRRLVVPQFPVPPQEYRADYMSNVVRSFSVFLQQFINPGDTRATTLTITGLGTSDSGLEVGALFQQDGFVKITLSYKPHPAGVSATSSLGVVSVSTT
jgi:hypothetical protein